MTAQKRQCIMCGFDTVLVTVTFAEDGTEVVVCSGRKACEKRRRRPVVARAGRGKR